MNRRTVLGLAGASAAVGLAGCLDGIQEHFGLQGVIPIEIYNEGEETHNLRMQAYDLDASRESYDESYAVSPDERVGPPHLDASRQSFRVAIVENEEEAVVREASITEDITLVVIRIYDDDLVVEVDRGDDAGNETVAGDDEAGNQTSQSDDSDDSNDADSSDDSNDE